MLSRIQLLKFAAAGSVVACMLGTPAQADELGQNLGPVGPHEPILTEVGSERVMAFYEPDNGRCAVHAGRKPNSTRRSSLMTVKTLFEPKPP